MWMEIATSHNIERKSMRPFTLECLKGRPLKAQPTEAFDSLCYVAELSAEEQDKRLSIPWMNRKARLNQGEDDNSGFRAFMVAACLCDSERKFMASGTPDIESLAESLAAANSKEVTRLATVIAMLNGIGDTSVETIEKN